MGCTAASSLSLHRANVSLQRLGPCLAECAGGGFNHLCKKINAKIIFDAISEHKVTHFGGAPVVLGLLINAPEIDQKTFKHSVNVMTAGAPPPPAVLEKVERLGNGGHAGLWLD